VGLAARYMEERGIATVVLTPTWEFHYAVGIPRSAAIEYPYGRPVGQVGDRDGQRQVLTAALAMFNDTESPGEIRHLPFTWPEDPRNADWHPPEISPIIKQNLDKIKQMKT